jgi:PAS domain S-box-containing protein
VAGRKKDGSRVVAHLSASLVRDDDGKPIGTLCSFVDITRSRQAFEELRLKDYAIASSINGIVFGDLEGRVTYGNAAAIDLIGYTLEEVLGWSILTFADNQEEAALIFAKVLEKGSWIGEVAGRKKDGSRIVVHLSASLVHGEDGEPVCTLCSFVDVTEKNRAQEDLRKTLDELEQRVAGRTIDLTEANEKLRREIEERKLAERNLRQKERELQLNALHLEETNIAMKVLLEQREKDKNELEEKVLTNVRGLLLPCLERLQGCRLNDRQKVYADILETNLQAIISPFLHRLSSRSLNLTPAEIQVAGLVKDGKSSKEIASLMNVSERGVEFHRNNIRRKLGLNNAKKNLRSYLLSLS